MSLYAIGQRVWCKSQDSLGLVTEANYTPKAEYVIDLVTGIQRYVDGKLQHERVGRDWRCGSNDLRPADWCCDGCSRYLPTSKREYQAFDSNGDPDVALCWMCVNLIELSKEKQEIAASYGYTNHP